MPTTYAQISLGFCEGESWAGRCVVIAGWIWKSRTGAVGGWVTDLGKRRTACLRGDDGWGARICECVLMDAGAGLRAKLGTVARETVV